MRTLHHLRTSGGLYHILLQVTQDGTYQIREYKHSIEQGCFSMGSATYEQALAEYNRRIDDAWFYDSIAYSVKVV